MDESHALIPIDQVLIAWADEIVCMTREQEDRLRQLVAIGTPIINLNIPDSFAYRDKHLAKLIRTNYNKYLKENEG
jgi:predicted protein tyrosine phosphatase